MEFAAWFLSAFSVALFVIAAFHGFCKDRIR